MKTYEFDSQIKVVGEFAKNIDMTNLKNEQMFFNCDLHFAWQNGGEVTRSFIKALPRDWVNDDVVFDSRVHMLMPNWYPCIGGYHHDDIFRPENGQPDYDNMPYKAEHILGLVNAHIAPTNFAIGKASFNEVPKDSGLNIYQVWHDEVMKKLETGELTLQLAEDRKLYQFDWQTWHCGVGAVDNGYRWFGRVSRKTDRTKNITNEIRRQVQVYQDNLTEGW